MTLKSIITKPLSLVLILFFLSLIIRTTALDKFPVGIPDDNMIFVLNAKAVFYTGRDVTGLWHPLKFAPIPDEPAQAEIPYTLMAPIIGILPSSIFSAHIFHAVVNSFLVVVLFLIILRLFSIGPAFIVGLVACFNPWNIFFGRSAFEASLALFFYILGFYVLLKTTGWKKLWAFIPLAFGFYTYMAYKITFLPYVFAISFYTWSQINHRKFTKQYAVLLLLCLLLFSFFIFTVKSQTTAGRLGELTFISPNTITKQVNTERRDIIQNPFTNLFTNKASIAVKTVVAKYYGAFSPNYLFINNELTQRFHVFNHGYFYYADFIFFVLGFCYLFAYKRRLWIFLTFLLIISPIPSVISNVDTSYAMRSSLYFPFFYIFIGTGIWYLLTILKTKKYFMFGTAIITGIYIILITNFLYIYFFIQPIYGSEGAAFSGRVLSRYAYFANLENQPLTVIVDTPKNLYKNFIYYSDIYNRQTSKQVKDAFLTHSYLFKSVSFEKCADVKQLEKNRLYIFDSGGKCPLFKNSKHTLSIVQLFDSGGVYSIYQDTICSRYSLRPYIAGFTLGDFNVENLSQKKFCETFIIDYRK